MEGACDGSVRERGKACVCGLKVSIAIAYKLHTRGDIDAAPCLGGSCMSATWFPVPVGSEDMGEGFLRGGECRLLF